MRVVCPEGDIVVERSREETRRAVTQGQHPQGTWSPPGCGNLTRDLAKPLFLKPVFVRPSL